MRYAILGLIILIDCAVLYTLFGIGNLNLGWGEALIVFLLAADVLYSTAVAFLNDEKEA